MAGDFTVDLSEVEGFLDAFDNHAMEIVAEEVAKAMVEAGMMLESEAKLNARKVGAVDTGGLWGSIAWAARGDGMGRVVEVGTPLEYGAPVEFGVRPGGRMPPFGPLRQWAERKLGMSAGQSAVFTNNLRFRIARRGISAKPFLGPAFDDNIPALEGIFARAGDRAVARLARLGD